MSKSLTIKGPNLVKLLKKVKSLDMDMTKSGLDKSAKFLKAEAEQLAPIKSGAFKNAIELVNKGQVKEGEAQAFVGIALDSPAWKYAAKVERKHKIFRTLQQSKSAQVAKIFGININDFWNRQRI